MDIIVQGLGEKNFKPNQITLSFEFKTKAKSYEDALANGVSNVEKYFKLLESLEFNKEQVKTKSFRVSENRTYDSHKKDYVFDGYLFNQSATLEFDYDIKKMSEIMEKTSQQENPPTYRINFGVKDNKVVEEEIIALAYKEAEFQANAVAKASGKTVKNCVRVSFEPFDSVPYSGTRYETACFSKRGCADNMSESIQNVFVPEDIVLSKEIYCQFYAE